MIKPLKLFLIAIILSGLFSFGIQPITSKSIKIKKVYCNGDQVFFEEKSTDINIATEKTFFNKRKVREYAYLNTSLTYTPRFSEFVCHNDTMRIQMYYNHYDIYTIEIESMYFKKGTFEFDLYAYVKNNEVKCLPIVIKDFPDDCMKYRIKTGMK